MAPGARSEVVPHTPEVDDDATSPRRPPALPRALSNTQEGNPDTRTRAVIPDVPARTKPTATGKASGAEEAADSPEIAIDPAVAKARDNFRELAKTCEKLDVKLAVCEGDFAPMGSSEDFLRNLELTRFGFRHLLKAFAEQCTLSFGSTIVDFDAEYYNTERNLNQYLEGEDPGKRGLTRNDPADEMLFLADSLGKLDKSLVALIRGNGTRGASGLSLFIRSLQDCLATCKAQIDVSPKDGYIQYLNGMLCIQHMSQINGMLPAFMNTGLEHLLSERTFAKHNLLAHADKKKEADLNRLRNSQKDKTDSLQNQSTVAAVISSVTATCLQITYQQHPSGIATAVNFFWLLSLALSIACALWSQLASRWTVSAFHSSQSRWISERILAIPIILLSTSSLAFALGLICLAFSVFPHTAVPIVIVIVTSVATLICVLVGTWLYVEYRIMDWWKRRKLAKDDVEKSVSSVKAIGGMGKDGQLAAHPELTPLPKEFQPIKVDRLSEKRRAAIATTLKNLTVRETISVPRLVISAAAFSGDGKLFAAVGRSDDETLTLRVWDVGSSLEVFTAVNPSRHWKTSYSRPRISFSHDGKRLAIFNMRICYMPILENLASGEPSVSTRPGVPDHSIWPQLEQTMRLTFHTWWPDAQHFVASRNHRPAYVGDLVIMDPDRKVVWERPLHDLLVRRWGCRGGIGSLSTVQISSDRTRIIVLISKVQFANRWASAVAIFDLSDQSKDRFIPDHAAVGLTRIITSPCQVVFHRLLELGKDGAISVVMNVGDVVPTSHSVTVKEPPRDIRAQPIGMGEAIFVSHLDLHSRVFEVWDPSSFELLCTFPKRDEASLIVWAHDFGQAEGGSAPVCASIEVEGNIGDETFSSSVKFFGSKVKPSPG